MSLSVVSLFSGIGAYERALQNLGISFDLLHYCEIDSAASRCYSLIHGVDESKNLHDVTKIDHAAMPDFDMLVYSPPCQDISTAGQHAGITKTTRTGLMWTAVYLIKTKMPKYLVMENVKNLDGKYKEVLETYIETLVDIGYSCYCKVLNASEHGMPQNRQRLFMVGVRKDLSQDFTMPSPKVLTKHLRDYLPHLNIKTINKDIAYTVRIGGRKSKVGNRHNWDGYIINGDEYYLSAEDCLRLMGFTKQDYVKLSDGGISDGRIAKVAGNSLVICVAEAIFQNLLREEFVNI